MSQLKKALEKARKEREPISHLYQSKPTPIPDQSSVTQLANAPRLHAEGHAGLDMTNPSYTQTRSVEVDHHELINKRVFAVMENNSVVDQYKHLRTRILNKTRPHGYNTIAITSFNDQEGKSVTAVNLAVTMAKDRRNTVMLVDTDLRRPQVHSLLGIDSSPGLSDYFLHDTPLEEILVHPGIESLTVVPAGERLDDSTEIMGSHRMEELVAEMKKRYRDRYIIFDTPALQRCADALVLSSYVDGVVLVVRAGKTTTENYKAMNELMKEKNVLGVVLNDGPVEERWAY